MQYTYTPKARGKVEYKGLNAFLCGNLYPFIVAVLVLAGHVTSLEFYFCIPILISAIIGLFSCPSVKPFLTVMATFLYQLPLAHTPGDFGELTNSQVDYNPKYYFYPPFFITLAVLAALLLIALIYRFIRTAAPKINRRSPLIFPILFLCVAFITNGFLYEKYQLSNLFYGLAQVLVYFFIFYFVYYGIESIDRHELVSYLCYLSLLIAMILIGELAFVYLTYNDVISGGKILKEAIVLGWGVSNPIGFSMAMLLPMLTYGAMTQRRPAIYIIATALTWIGACFTLSRNAILFSTLFIIILLLFACRNALPERRKVFIVIAVIVAVGTILAAIYLRAYILEAFEILNKNGDNSRFYLWGNAFTAFKKNPIFGQGFFTTKLGDVVVYIGFLPTMAHNTIFIFMSTMGTVGIVSYLIYRAATLLPLLRRPSVEKWAFIFSILIVSAMSLLDNYIFYIYTMFYPMIILASAHKIVRDERKERLYSDYYRMLEREGRSEEYSDDAS